MTLSVRTQPASVRAFSFGRAKMSIIRIQDGNLSSLLKLLAGEYLYCEKCKEWVQTDLDALWVACPKCRVELKEYITLYKHMETAKEIHRLIKQGREAVSGS